MSRKQIKEGYSNLLKAGKSVLRSFSPELKQAGKKTFNKLARKGIKKFGKKGLKTAWNATKKIAQNKEVQNMAKDTAKDAAKWVQNKFKKKPKTQEALVESFSKIVDNSLNEAWGVAIKGALTGGKAALKGAAKTMGKQGLKNIGKMSGKKLMSNIGSSLANDAKQMASDAYDASAFGAVRNTFKDDKGNWSFSPKRALKKRVKGIAKTADNIFLGGLGQMAIDGLTSENEESKIKRQRKRNN